MTLLVLFLILFFPPTTLTRAHAFRDIPPTPRSKKVRIDKKLEREIRAAEDRLRRAIEKKDAASLDLLLADYYADGYEGSERAVGKKATLAKCKSGALHFYEIEKAGKLTVRGDLIQVEGVAQEEANTRVDNEFAADVHVTRLWTRKNGGWKLIAQTLGAAEDELKKKDRLLTLQPPKQHVHDGLAVLFVNSAR